MTRQSLLALMLAASSLLLLPFFVAAQDWVPIGPNTGEVHNLFFTPHNSNTVYASGVLAPEHGYSSQLMVSADGGYNFTYLRRQQMVRGMAFHPTSTDTLWMLENNMYSRSVDGGMTWDDQSIPGSQSTMTDIARDLSLDGYLYMLNTTTSRSVLIRSQDEGETWDEVYEVYYQPDEYLYGLYFRPGVTDTLYTIRSVDGLAVEGDGIWRSMDGGETWEFMGQQGLGSYHWDMKPMLYFHPTDHSLILGMGEVFQGDFGIISRDGGSTFQLLTGPWGGSEWVRPFIVEDGTIYLVTQDNLWVSYDAANTWSEALSDPGNFPPNMYPFIEPADLILSPYNPDLCFISYQDIFLHSSDGGETWDASVQGFTGTSALEVYTSLADPNVIHAKTHGGFFRTEDRGDTWSAIGIGQFMTTEISQVNADYLVRWEYEHPWLSPDGGQSWIELEELSNTTSFAFHPDDDNVILTIANPQGSPPAVYRSDDGGETWSISAEFGHWSGTLYWDMLDHDRVLLLNGSGDMLESLDGGYTFNEFNVGEPLVKYSMQPDGPGAVALGSSLLEERGLYTSDCTDPSFPSRFTIPNEENYLDFAPDGWLVSHRYDNTWISPDLGHMWWPIYQSYELESTANRTVGVASDGTIYVAGGSQGVLMSTNALRVDEHDLASGPYPRQFSLVNVYPNPFNGSAVIAFDVPVPEVVSMRLVDILGREVASLAEGSFASGIHEVKVNGSELSSGTYFIRAQAGSSTAFQRITLVK